MKGTAKLISSVKPARRNGGRGHWASDTDFFYFVTDGQKCDYLSRGLQCARGATKNTGSVIHLGYHVLQQTTYFSDG